MIKVYDIELRVPYEIELKNLENEINTFVEEQEINENDIISVVHVERMHFQLVYKEAK